jgi:hypothetical protein
MDHTSAHVVPEHLKDKGILIATMLTDLDRDEAVEALGVAQLLVERLFDDVPTIRPTSHVQRRSSVHQLRRVK